MSNKNKLDNYLFISLDPSKFCVCLNIFCALLSILLPKFEFVDLLSTFAVVSDKFCCRDDLFVVEFNLISLFVEKYGMNVLQTHRLYAS